MTGSRAQWYNGMVLLTVFFCCRLLWGTYQSVQVFRDIFKAPSQTSAASTLRAPFDIHTMIFQTRDVSLCVKESCIKANDEISKFANHQTDGVPFWLVLTYLGSNLILNSLNFYWFSKMIETVMKRFRAPAEGQVEKERTPLTMEKEAEALVLEAASTLEKEEGIFINGGAGDETPDASRLEATTSTGTQHKSPGARRRKA